MASYHASHDTYDTDDSRPTQSSRRHESFSRRRDAFLTPSSAGPRYTAEAGGYRSRSNDGRLGGERREGQDDYGRPERKRRSWNDRYSLASPSLPTPPAPHQTPTFNRRHTWPPHPYCEDEATSLLKEAGGARQLQSIDREGVRSRGTLEQEPIIEDASNASNDEENSFVTHAVPQPKQPALGVPTPPTSEDERTRREGRRPSRLAAKFDSVLENSVPELQKRSSSPYAFSRPTRSPKDEPSGDRYPSSSDLLSPPPTDSRGRGWAQFSDARPSASPQGSPMRDAGRRAANSPRRDSARYSPSSREGMDYFNLSSADESALDDTDYDTSDSATKSHRYKPSTYPPTPRKSKDIPKTSPQTSVVDFAPPPNAPPSRRPDPDFRRNTDSGNPLSMPSDLRVPKTTKLAPIITTGVLGAAAGAFCDSPATVRATSETPLSRSSAQDEQSSRESSPLGSTTQSPSPQRSNCGSAEIPTDQVVNRLARSRAPSFNGSQVGSQPSSPTALRAPVESPRVARIDHDWSTVRAAANAASRRPKAPSRLSTLTNSPLYPENVPYQPRHPSPDTRSTSMPLSMSQTPATPPTRLPSERPPQFFPETRVALVPAFAYDESQTVSRSASPDPSSSSYSSTLGLPRAARPGLPLRHSTSEVVRTDKSPISERLRPDHERRISFTAPSQPPARPVASRPMERCPKKYLSGNYDDWYKPTGATNLYFCAECFKAELETAGLRSYFRATRARDSASRVHCAFGRNPWIRLAWSMEREAPRPNITTLMDLASIDEMCERCPGNYREPRTWYGIRDAHGAFASNFHVCWGDVQKAERLFPALEGLFEHLPTTSFPDRCDFRPEGERFKLFTGTLLALHAQALTSGDPPDRARFAQLAARRGRLRDCPKGSLRIDQLWHYMPDVPDSPCVCEECFETIIEPEIARSSSSSPDNIAARFSRTKQQRWDRSGTGTPSFCALYSPHVRKAFFAAVRKKDVRILTRETRAMERDRLRLDEKMRPLLRKREMLARDSAFSEGEEEERVQRSMDRLMGEFKDKWE